MIADRLIAWAQGREPEFTIGGKDRPYLKRHKLVANWLFGIYVHEFCRSDDDRALHDHPWLFNATRVLRGSYVEWTPTKTHRARMLDPMHQYPTARVVPEGGWRFRPGRAPHRVQLFETHAPGEELVRPGTTQRVWTLFIRGPRVWEWGFYCGQGWIPWFKFVAPGDRGDIGKGCDQ